ncbi:MAG TPA: carboxylesterase family protein [Polyangiales bacterium]
MVGLRGLGVHLRSGILLLTAIQLGACGGSEDDGGGTQQQPGNVTADGGADAGSGDAGSAGGNLGPVSADGLTVAIKSGKIKGKLEGNTREFLGIPYGKAERFAPSAPADSWTNERDATKHGAPCLQAMSALSPMGAEFSDDCLTVNVYAPNPAPSAGLPVYVFIHGGAFTSGGSAQYDAKKLSEGGPLVAVTLNYRLGPFGFLSHPDLDAKRNGVPSGNDGIRDQQLALRWIQENIAAFGGDPKKVTITGESAGAMSACLHMVSPSSRELGPQFVLQSGVCTQGASILKSRADSDTIGKALVTQLCAGQPDILACLRGKPVQEVASFNATAGLTGAGWAPVYAANDPILPDHPKKLIDAGNYNKGNVILGSNAREWGLFQRLGSPSPADETALNAAIDMALGATLGAGAPLVKMHYKPAMPADANPNFIRLMTDSAFRCAARSFARLVSSKGSKVWLYSFEQGDAFHAYEIPYVFGNSNVLLAPMLDAPTVATVQGYWSKFVVSGDPNGKVQPTWPQYDATSDQHVTLQSASAVGSNLSKADCDFWDSLGG